MSNLKDLIFDSYSVSLDDWKDRSLSLFQKCESGQMFSLYLPKGLGFEKYVKKISVNTRSIPYSIKIINYNSSTVSFNYNSSLPEIKYNAAENSISKVALDYNFKFVVPEDSLKTCISEIGLILCFEHEDENLESRFLIENFNKSKWNEILYRATEDLKKDRLFLSCSFNKEFVDIIEFSIKNIQETNSLLSVINIISIFDFIYGNERYPENKTFVDVRF